MRAPFVALALLLAIPSVPFEARGADVAVLDLRLSEATPAVEKQVTQWLQASLRGAGYEVLKSGTVKKRLASLSGAPGCVLGPCLVRVGERLKVKRVLVGGIAVHGSSYDILLSLVDTESGCPLAQVSARCDVCNFVDVGESVARAAKQLYERAKRYEASQARLVVKEPAGATVLLDGVPLGKAPLSRLTAPGRHSLELRGAKTALKTRVLLIAGQRYLHGAASPHPAVPSSSALRSTPRRSPGWPAWLALGGGGALLFSGVVALALDEDCPTGSCDGRRETRGAGLALIGLGAALTATAGVLFWRAARTPHQERAAFGSFSVAGGKGTLGVAYSSRF